MLRYEEIVYMKQMMNFALRQKGQSLSKKDE